MKKENLLFGTFDLETNRMIDFEILGFFDGCEYLNFFTPKKFLDFINQRKYKGWRFFAHNGGKFDVLFLLKDIFSLGWKIRVIEKNGRVIAIYVTTKRTNFIICDSYALLPQNLDSLTKAFNVEHKKIPFDFSKRKVSKKDPRLLKHLLHDCYGLYEVVKAFFASDYIVHPQLTIASQALDTFRSLFQSGELQKMPIEDEIFFRNNWYAGGRVEVFKGYAKRVYSYDVNSLFPFAMLEDMPAGKVFTTSVYRPGMIGFYRVWIHSLPDFYISPLLLKRKNGTGYSNYYVNGKGEYYLSSTVLDYLKKYYGVRWEVLDGYYFKSKFPLLREYVETFYKIKSENEKNSALYVIAKLMLNTLYGKFGQLRWKESVEAWTPELKNFVAFDNDFGLVLVTKESHSKFILPYLAAYITDFARLYHWQLMQQVEKSVFYCDTDSIFSSLPLPNDLIGKEIGKLSYLGKWEGVFLAPKSYALKNGKEEKVVFKGFDASEFSFHDFEKALRNGFVLEMEKERMLSFKESMNRKGGIIRQKSPFLKMVNTTKKVRSQYDKREIVPDTRTVFDSKPLGWFPE